MTLVEAFAAGLPVVTSKLGSMASVVEHGHTGLHFEPGDPAALAAQVAWALEHPAELKNMRGALEPSLPPNTQPTQIIHNLWKFTRERWQPRMRRFPLKAVCAKVLTALRSLVRS